MAVNFQRDKVAIECDGCGINLISFIQMDMPLTQALNYADNYRNPIFCKLCSVVPDVAPDKELLN